MHDIWWIVLIVYPPLLFILAYMIRGTTVPKKTKKIETSIPNRIFLCNDGGLDVQPWIDANPDYTIRVYTLPDCRSMLEEHISIRDYAVTYFDALHSVQEKIAFWAMAVVYLYGGIAVNGHYRPISSISSILPSETTLCITKKLDNKLGTAFVASTPRNPVLENILAKCKEGTGFDIDSYPFADIVAYPQRTILLHEYNPQFRPLLFSFQNEQKRDLWRKKTELVSYEGSLRLPFMNQYAIL